MALHRTSACQSFHHWFSIWAGGAQRDHVHRCILSCLPFHPSWKRQSRTWIGLEAGFLLLAPLLSLMAFPLPNSWLEIWAICKASLYTHDSHSLYLCDHLESLIAFARESNSCIAFWYASESPILKLCTDLVVWSCLRYVAALERHLQVDYLPGRLLHGPFGASGLCSASWLLDQLLMLLLFLPLEHLVWPFCCLFLGSLPGVAWIAQQSHRSSSCSVWTLQR